MVTLLLGPKLKSQADAVKNSPEYQELLKQIDINTKSMVRLTAKLKDKVDHYNKNLKLAISNMSSYIYNCNNDNMLKDLLNSIDTGFNYRLEYRHDNLEKLLIENTNITIEQNNCLERIEENTQNI
jgi:hypothetical protein